MKGEVVYFTIHDFGASIDLDEIRRKVKMPLWEAKIAREKAAPKYVTFPEPILIHVEQKVVETTLGPRQFDIVAKLFSVGAISISMRTPFSGKDLMEFRDYADLKIKEDGKEIDLDSYTKRILERIEAEIRPFYKEMYRVVSQPESYTVYCVVEAEEPAREWVNNRKKDITALLANDPHPERLSEEEVHDTWKYWFSYYDADLVVIDWDAALIYEPTGRYEDTLLAMEIANLQLLELRTYDLFLDEVIDEAYDDLELFFSRGGLLRSGRQMIKEMSDIRMDLSEVTDEVSNISKFFGDWFLAKIYMGCKKKFELESWQKMVHDKLETLSNIYEVAGREVEGRRLVLLEVLIVILFLVDLVLIVILG